MPAFTSIVHLVLGLSLGLSLAWLHALASRRAAAWALAKQSSAGLLLGFPIRVAVPAAAMFALVLLSPWSLAGGMLSFLIGQRLALARLCDGHAARTSPVLGLRPPCGPASPVRAPDQPLAR